jgi:hypothetical protein
VFVSIHEPDAKSQLIFIKEKLGGSSKDGLTTGIKLGRVVNKNSDKPF